MKYQYECPECHGSGEVRCGCCGSDTECDYCYGSRVDPEIVDIERFECAEDLEHERHKGPSWALVEDGVFVGRCGGKDTGTPAWTLRYSDFLKEPHP